MFAISISAKFFLFLYRQTATPRRADDTWWLTHGKVGRRQGFFLISPPLLCIGGFFIAEALITLECSSLRDC